VSEGCAVDQPIRTTLSVNGGGGPKANHVLLGTEQNTPDVSEYKRTS